MKFFLFAIALMASRPTFAATQGRSTASARQEFNLRIFSEPPTLDWNLATDNVSITLLQNLMEGLAGYSNKGGKLTPVPALASRWDVSKDGKTYTYHIRQGVTWSDGAPLTAQHFWDSWERALNPKTGSEYAYFLFDVVGAKDYNEGKLKDTSKLGFKVIDSSTFQVTLDKRASYFANIPTFTVTFPIRKDLIEKNGSPQLCQAFQRRPPPPS